MNSEEFFFQINNNYQELLPFAAYRKPNNAILNGCLQTDNSLHSVIDYSESGVIFAPFDASEKIILFPSSHCTMIRCEGSFLFDNETIKIKSETSNEDKQSHMRLVEKAILNIQNQTFQKVVISRSENVEVKLKNPIDVFKNLLSKYTSAFVYIWYHPKVGLWLGATPESLLEVEGNRLTTMSLAGTKNYDGSVDVIWEEKEKKEQQIVTDYLVASLEPLVSHLKIDDVKTARAGNLLHLKTKITATLRPDSLNLGKIIKTLHPTPAVCGLPKEICREFILKHENYNREYYTGFLGELNIKERKSRNSNSHNVENDAYATVKNVSNLYVNLRCMQFKQNNAIIYVGGGITKDSIPENEWEETVAKSQVIKSVL